MKDKFTLAALVMLTSAGFCHAQKPTFEAAPVKVQDPSARVTPGANNPGRVHLVNRPLLSLIATAYGVSGDQIAGRPAWMREPNLEQFEVVATMPPNATRADMPVMLQSLLEERFRLAVHHETQPFPGYELVVSNSGAKLRVSNRSAQPANPDPAKPLPTGNDGFPVFPPGPRRFNLTPPGAYRVKYQEWSMGQLVADLPMMLRLAQGTDPAEKQSRVVDKTGLMGNYDFVLEFRCARCNSAATAGDSTAERSPALAPSEPFGESGMPDIFVALQEQLGLRLVKVRDVQVDVLVIDHVDRLPGKN